MDKGGKLDGSFRIVVELEINQGIRGHGTRGQVDGVNTDGSNAGAVETKIDRDVRDLEVNVQGVVPSKANTCSQLSTRDGLNNDLVQSGPGQGDVGVNDLSETNNWWGSRSGDIDRLDGLAAADGLNGERDGGCSKLVSANRQVRDGDGGGRSAGSVAANEGGDEVIDGGLDGRVGTSVGNLDRGGDIDRGSATGQGQVGSGDVGETVSVQGDGEADVAQVHGHVAERVLEVGAGMDGDCS